MELKFAPRRATYVEITADATPAPLSPEELEAFESFDLVYRSLCALMYNYVPMSGHPGGSISSGRFVSGILFDAMDYDVSDPAREDADIISYAAGHKALGLYALWALRNEVMRIAAADLLPDPRHQLRLEDLLGFRRNPTTCTPLFRKLGVKPLDGHPTPATPFVRLATGASGVGVAGSIGLAWGAMDYYGDAAPRVHIVEGEGGMTPGRVSEAMAAAGTACLGNIVMHVDWNQASIDSNHVCRDGDTPGDYVQWNPAELAYLHDWNAIMVPDGTDFQQVIAAQRQAAAFDNGQPTAIVYRTTKGWQYGIEGRASHGAGHKLCSDAFFETAAPLLDQTGTSLPRCEPGCERCEGGDKPEVMEQCFWDALQVVRKTLEEKSAPMVERFAGRLKTARKRLDDRSRAPRRDAPQVDRVYEVARRTGAVVPDELRLKPGAVTTLRAELGRALNYYNRAGDGALLAAAGDLMASTSVNLIANGFPDGYFNARTNPGARLLATGGICEDAMAGILSGLSSYGRHIGVGSSYAAFIAALGHVAARLHAIGNQARQAVTGEPYRPMVLICAHAGLKTGEDGPTHADPTPLQLLQENFPPGTIATLTPWDPCEIWPLITAAIAARPAVIAPFVTRPNERVIDREALGLAPGSAAVSGVYLLRRAAGGGDGTVVLQGSGVTYAFVEQALPLLEQERIDLNVYYVASAELFDRLPQQQRAEIFPEERAFEAIGITGFTLPTLYRWVRSDRGRAASLHPFRAGHFLGSGQADKVLLEAGLDGDSQFRAIRSWVKKRLLQTS